MDIFIRFKPTYYTCILHRYFPRYSTEVLKSIDNRKITRLRKCYLDNDIFNIGKIPKGSGTCPALKWVYNT